MWKIDMKATIQETDRFRTRFYSSERTDLRMALAVALQHLVEDLAACQAVKPRKRTSVVTVEVMPLKDHSSNGLPNPLSENELPPPTTT